MIFLDIQAAPIIADFDDDVAALVIARKGECRAGLVLAGPAPVFRSFQAMIGRIAHHMGERILDQFENLAVKLRIG